MKARRERLIRAAALTQTLWRLEVLRGVRLDQALAQLGAAERAALDSLARRTLPPAAPLRQLSLTAMQKVSLKDALAIQNARTQDQGRRAKRMEKVVERAEAEYRRAVENDERQRISESVASSNVSVR